MPQLPAHIKAPPLKQRSLSRPSAPGSPAAQAQASAQAASSPPPAKRSDDPRDYVDKRLPPRIRKAIDAMVLSGMRRPDAAASVGIKDNTLYKHLQNPIAARYYQRQLQVLRESEKARNVAVAIDLRETSQSGKVRIDAMKYIDGHHEKDKAGITVNVGVQVRPGYIVDVSQHAEKAAHILQVSGSKRNAMEDQ